MSDHKPVFNVVNLRGLSDKKLSLQTLSNLLWAACGVNRKKGPFGISGRTAASASNSQEIDLYAANVYLFAAQGLIAWFHNCNKTILTEKLNLLSD